MEPGLGAVSRTVPTETPSMLKHPKQSHMIQQEVLWKRSDGVKFIRCKLILWNTLV